MSDIPTWHERAMEHPDHQSGMISEDMIRARMCEEIEDLRAEVVRLRVENEEKQRLIDAASQYRNDLRAHIDKTYALLKDSNVVAVNMLRGVIALPSVDQIRHIYQQRLEAEP